MKTYQELMNETIRSAVQKLPHSGAKDKEVNENVSQVIAFLKQYRRVMSLLEDLAKVVIANSSKKVSYEDEIASLYHLQSKTKAIVNIGLNQQHLAENILNQLWTTDLIMAAGRIMRAASLGVDPAPEDVAHVNEVERRAPLILEHANHIWLGIEMDDLKTDAIQEALDHVPENKPVIFIENKHPLEGEDDEINRHLKHYASNTLWTKDVLMAAGNIAAKRSLLLNPSWDDVEAVYKADYLTRCAVTETRKKIDTKLKNALAVDLEEAIKATVVETENHYHQKEQGEHGLQIKISKKIAQLVWIAHPHFARAKASLEKHGTYYTPHGDMLLVQSAHDIEQKLFDNITHLLKAREEKILNESQPTAITWLWGRKMGDDENKLYLSPDDVTHELINKATRMLRQ